MDPPFNRFQCACVPGHLPCWLTRSRTACSRKSHALKLMPETAVARAHALPTLKPLARSFMPRGLVKETRMDFPAVTFRHSGSSRWLFGSTQRRRPVATERMRCSLYGGGCRAELTTYCPDDATMTANGGTRPRGRTSRCASGCRATEGHSGSRRLRRESGGSMGTA